jgi:hypothetical protein
MKDGRAVDTPEGMVPMTISLGVATSDKEK